MNRVLLMIVAFVVIAGVAIYGDPDRIAQAKTMVSGVLHMPHSAKPRAVEIKRTRSGDFSLRAKINGVDTPMVVDTGATSVVLTWETAKAAGLPLEVLDYDVEIETAGGKARAAKLTLDRLAIGKLVERSVPALVAPRGQLKTNLLGMTFLNRLESFEMRDEKLVLRGYP